MPQPPGPAASSHSFGSILQLLVIVLLTLILPGAIRLPRIAAGDAPPRVPYLPSLEGTGEVAFHAHRLKGDSHLLKGDSHLSPVA